MDANNSLILNPKSKGPICHSSLQLSLTVEAEGGKKRKREISSNNTREEEAEENQSDSADPSMERNGSVPSSTLLLDRVGDVVLTINSDGLSWKSLNSDSSTSFCLDMMLHLKTTSEIKFSDVYAIEFIDWGLIHNVVWNAGGFLSSKNSEMYRFVVHGVHRSKTGHSPWVLSSYTFGHKDLQTCQTWVEQINACINKEVGRPKSLLVFVHPLCGKGKGLETWETVVPIFVRAKVKTMVNITQRAGHAYDVITSCTDRELSSFDGIVSVGGDGLFNEVLNGLLSSRHKVPYPPTPVGFNSARSNVQLQPKNSSSSNGRASFDDRSGIVSETSYGIDVHEPLLATSEPSGLGISKFKAAENGSQTTDQDIVLSFPNDWFRLGIIPAGSTDAIVISTTGVRDPVTSALHIILGKKVPLDIAQVVRWKTSPSSIDVPSVRYAASFAGYGFYGDVIKESEKYRWMGPKRYDYAGTKVFLEHRSYEAEVAFLAANTVQPVTVTDTSGSGTRSSLLSRKKVVCRMNCSICKGTTNSCILANRSISDHDIHVEGFKWLRSKGHFLSVGAAVISCRNERAPEGLVADAHLSDGFLHLILVKDCPRPLYLWHLTQLTRRGTDPLNFKFVEHHKTPAFTFVSNHDESAWNLDGEIFQACQVSVQACRGLINLFASGPEV